MIAAHFDLSIQFAYDQHSDFSTLHSLWRYENEVHYRGNMFDVESVYNSDGSGQQESNGKIEEKVEAWLRELGLQFNPFDSKFLDAGADPALHAYLVGHEAFTTIWSDKPSFMYAPAGGGKSAFRVRLTRACRVGQDGRRIFPIVYKMPSPADFETWPPNLEEHLEFVNQAAAAELLLGLAYRPNRYFELDLAIRQMVRAHLAINLPLSLDYLLDQLDEAGNLSPLVEDFDPTAAGLLNPPDAASIRRLCADLRSVSEADPDEVSDLEQASASVRFRLLTRLIQDKLGYEAIYMLVDGVDASIEVVNDSQMGVMLIQSLLAETATWANEQIYLKYFLPYELEAAIQAASPVSSSQTSTTTRINWTVDMLVELLRERLQVASQGMFRSLDAISSPDLRGTDLNLVLAARPLPREVLLLAGRLLLEHVRRAGPTGKLEPADLERARQWYVDQQQQLELEE